MARVTVSDPGLGKLFSGLSSAFSGASPADLINADVNRVKRNGMLVDNQLTAAKLQAQKRGEAAIMSLSELLANGELDYSDPAVRAQLSSIIARTPDGMQYGPDYALGTSVFIDPDAFDRQELSNVGFANGSSYSTSPAGLSETLASEEKRTQMQQDAETQRAMLPGGGSNRAPLDVSPADMKTLQLQVDEYLKTQFTNGVVDPALRQNVLTRASQIYQQTRNTGQAIELAVGDFAPDYVDPGGNWNPFDHLFGVFSPDNVKGTVVPQPIAPVSTPVLPSNVAAVTGNPVVGAPPQQPAAPAMPAGGAAPANPAAPQFNPLMQDARGQSLPSSLQAAMRQSSQGPVLIQNGQSIPVTDGLTVTFQDPALGIINYVWQGGQWVRQ